VTTSIIQFLVSAGVIIAAGTVLTRCADVISVRTRLGHLLAGSLLLATATSLPELATDIHAVRLGSVDLAVGDVFGSCLFNLLILTVLDLTRYSHGSMLSRQSAAHALAASISIGLTAIGAVFILLGPKLKAATFLNLGPGSFLLLIAYAVGARLVFVARKISTEAGEADRDTAEPAPRVIGLGELTLKKAIVGYVVSAAAILAAAPFLARAADDLAERSGLGGTFIGTTAVALCTSLPELVTTLAAVRMRAFDLALGNIFGSNAFNLVVLAPLDAFHDGSLLSAVAPTHVYTALCVIVVTTVMVLGQLYQVEKRKPLLEPDALLSLVLIVGAFTGLYFLREAF
jgi:cation:H+ antiporter